MERKYNITLVDLRKAQETPVVVDKTPDLTRQHRAEIDRINRDHETEKKALLKELSDLKLQWSDLQKQIATLEKKLAQKDNEHNSFILQLKSGHAAQVDQLKKDLNNRAGDDLKAKQTETAHKLEVVKLQNTHSEKVQGLDRQINDLKNQVKQKESDLTLLTTKHKAGDQNVKQMETTHKLEIVKLQNANSDKVQGLEKQIADLKNQVKQRESELTLITTKHNAGDQNVKQMETAHKLEITKLQNGHN